jgi:CRP/FNR family cyclic AMP-dependent transcriptional regulator
VAFASFFDYPGQPSAEEQRPDVADLLPDLDDAGWDRLLAYTQVVRFGQGQTVIEAGTHDRSLYIIADGIVEMDGPEGVVTAESGAVIGEVPFFDGGPHSATIRAVTDVDLITLSPDAFEVLAAREPSLTRALIMDLGRIVSLRLRDALVVRGREGPEQ